MFPRSWLVLALALVPATVAAAPEREIDYVVVEPPNTLWHDAAKVIYLNRCTGGCSVVAGADDALANTSSILGRNGLPGQVSIAEFAWDQATWDAMVACVQGAYALYGAQVVTEPPAGPHAEVLVGGTADALGLAPNTLGIAPLANNCSALPSAIAFAFANAHASGPTLIKELCATAAHEAGHIYGLDHEFDCRDPMTYLASCGPKVFLNRTVPCGEFDGTRPCKCDEMQSSHQHLSAVLGFGALPVPAQITIDSPPEGSLVPATFSVFATVEGRPAALVELWINGAKAVEVPGKQSASPYELTTQRSLFDGVLDLEVRVYDDLGQVGVARRTVTKGVPCASADSCPSGYTCDAGRCRAPAGRRGVGDGCARDEDCTSAQCALFDGDLVCTQPCWPTGAACPGGLTCMPGADEGYGCFAESGGCCSAGSDPRGSIALAVLALGAVLLRTRRARSA